MRDSTKPRITPQEAGRLGGLKGGKSRSAAKLAACKANGFQRSASDEPAVQTYRVPSPRPAVLISQPRPEGQ